MTRLLVFVFSIIVIASCKGKETVPKDILPREKMQEVLWSMINAGEFLNGYVFVKDSVDKTAESSKIYGRVLQVHQVSREQFDKSYAYYRAHPGLMKIILDTLAKKQAYRPGTFQRREDSMRGVILKDTSLK